MGAQYRLSGKATMSACLRGGGSPLPAPSPPLGQPQRGGPEARGGAGEASGAIGRPQPGWAGGGQAREPAEAEGRPSALGLSPAAGRGLALTHRGGPVSDPRARAPPPGTRFSRASTFLSPAARAWRRRERPLPEGRLATVRGPGPSSESRKSGFGGASM